MKDLLKRAKKAQVRGRESCGIPESIGRISYRKMFILMFFFPCLDDYQSKPGETLSALNYIEGFHDPSLLRNKFENLYLFYSTKFSSDILSIKYVLVLHDFILFSYFL